ncbi:MAG: hypothetical protein ACPF80_03730 [Flavobacteriaceae bacterium]
MKPLIFLLLLSLTNCAITDNEPSFTPSLPPVTTTGENTFGCYLDGVLVTPRDGSGDLYRWREEGMKVTAGKSLNKVHYNEIRVRDYKSGTRGVVEIYFEPVIYDLGEGVFTLQNSKDVDTNGQPIVVIAVRLRENWYRSAMGSGEVHLLRVDSINHIVSGTFACEAIGSSNPNDRIKITEGRFDINRATLRETFFQ